MLHERKYTFLKLIIYLLCLGVISITGEEHEKNSSLIYILIWEKSDWPPFYAMRSEGQQEFIKRNCKHQNCFLSHDRGYLGELVNFDVVLFDAIALSVDKEFPLPKERSPEQRYVMVTIEPPTFYPLLEKFNGFFNLTWTFKFASDIALPYIVVKDQYGEVVGPKADMNWIDIREMNETSDFVKSKLKKKKLAAAWMASNCNMYRLHFVEDLQHELEKYGHRVDVFGACGDMNCAKSVQDECYALIESDYYFYLAFENSYDHDYVTEKLLTALEHYTVPVVCGGANYSRFMPKGIYLNAYTLGVQKLARKMAEIISDKEIYYNFFRWHGYYSFHESNEDGFLREICSLCDFLNNQTRMSQRSVYNNITGWWNEKYLAYPQRYKLAITEDKVEEPGVVGFAKNVINYFFGD